jgi:hypothetical protein
MLLRLRNLIICILLVCLLFFSRNGFSNVFSSRTALSSSNGLEVSANYPSEETLGSLFLTPAQCDAAFPGLNLEIERAAARGPFELKKAAKTTHGLVEGRIRDGKVRLQPLTWLGWLKKPSFISYRLSRTML